MIYLVFLGLLHTHRLRADDVDPCQDLECGAGCLGLRDVCLATPGCIWKDTSLCSSSDGNFEPYCCISPNVTISTTMFDDETTTVDIETTPSPTSCYDDEDGWTIDEIGKSSQFRFISNCDDNQFVKIKMVSLTEYDIKDKKTKNKITSFASSECHWITNENDTYNGFDAVVKKYVSTLKLKGNYKKTKKVDFNLTTILFKEEAEVGNRTITQNTLKWTTDIDGWPFIDDNNTLELCINVMTNGGKYANSGTDYDDGDNERFTFSDFEFRLINTAYCGDDKVDVEIYENQKNFNQLDICFIYDACDDVIDHDPFVRYIGNDDNGDNGDDGDDANNGDNNDGQGALTTGAVGISVGVGIAAFILLAFAVLAGVYFRKNQKLRKGTILLNSANKGGYDALKNQV